MDNEQYCRQLSKDPQALAVRLQKATLEVNDGT